MEVSKTEIIWTLSILLVVLIGGFMLRDYIELVREETTLRAIEDYNDAVLKEFKDYGFLKIKYPIKSETIVGNETVVEDKIITIELRPITQEEINTCLYYESIVKQLNQANS